MLAAARSALASALCHHVREPERAVVIYGFNGFSGDRRPVRSVALWRGPEQWPLGGQVCARTVRAQLRRERR